ncbi:hypothetical protein [Segeticoccus rhizosphaerae]|uniref:hypothetical protein n=1 Tax=Segeticoccus rhizosphaerae TaxID=1104777 RepID=UPI0010C12AE4|nr:hypothetical protein [Ornithinicoccus soli]
MLWTDWVPLAGTVIGAGVAILVQQLGARREDRRESRRWAREEARQWLQHRREMYVETGVLQYRWLQLIQERSEGEAKLREEFREHLVLLELIAPTEVRNAAHAALAALEELGQVENAPKGAAGSAQEQAIMRVAHLNHLMRADLGVTDDASIVNRN